MSNAAPNHSVPPQIWLIYQNSNKQHISDFGGTRLTDFPDSDAIPKNTLKHV